jgi:hypothetical protein
VQRDGERLDDEGARSVDEDEFLDNLTGANELLHTFKGDDTTCRPALAVVSMMEDQGGESGGTYSDYIWAVRLSATDFGDEMFGNTGNSTCVLLRRLHVWRVKPKHADIRGYVGNSNV